MLGTMSVLFMLCQVVAFSSGRVLPPSQASEETCLPMYQNCSVTDNNCCPPFRCLNFSNGFECSYSTDNPSVVREAGNAVQPPIDLINNLGCSLFGQNCVETDDCCSPFVCVGDDGDDGTCQDPDVDPYGLGGYGGYGGYGGPGNPGK